MSQRTSLSFDHYLYILIVVVLCSDLNNFFSIFLGTKELLSFPIFLITFFLLFKFLLKKKKNINTPLIIYLALFAFFLGYGAVLNFLIDFPNQETLYRYRYYFPAIIITIISTYYFSTFIRQGKLLLILRVFFFSFFFNSVLIILNGVIGISFVNGISENLEVERAGGLITNVNQAGSIAVIGQIFSVYLLLSNKNKVNGFVLFACYVVCIIAATVTFSKAAFLNTIVIFLMFIYYLVKAINERKLNGLKKNKSKLYIILGWTTIVSLLAVLNFNYYYSTLSNEQKNRILQFYSLMQGQINEETTTKRSEIAKVAIYYIKDNPIIGYGLGTFHKLPLIKYGTHNEYLLLWGEIGILGFFLYILFFISCFSILKRIKISDLNFLINSLLILFVSISFVSHNVLNTKFLCVLLGLLIGFSLNVKYINLKYAWG